MQPTIIVPPLSSASIDVFRRLLEDSSYASTFTSVENYRLNLLKLLNLLLEDSGSTTP
jgi:hypothetical protein